MILQNILGGLFARLPRQYVWPAITVVLVAIAVGTVWQSLQKANARELSAKDVEIARLKIKNDSLLVVIISDKTNRINELAEDNRKLETRNEEVNDYVYENRLRDEINKSKIRSTNQELRQVLKKKAP